MKFAYASVAALAAVAAIGAAGYSLAQAPAAAPAPAAPAGPPAPATAADLKPGAYTADPGHTKVNWMILHGGFSPYSGIIPDVTADLTIDADPAKSSISVTIPLVKMITGSAGLDRHLQNADFFDVPNFPTATFKSTSIAVTGPNTGKVTGDLTIRNVTKPVTLDVKFVKGAAGRNGRHQLGFDASTVIKRSQWGINYGPTSGDDVEIRIGAEFRAAAPAAPAAPAT